MTLPTPWPVILISFAISFIITLRGLKSSLSPSKSILPRILDHLSTGINSVRAITAFITALAVIRTNSARFESPSALVMMIFSISPSIIPRNRWDRPRAALGAINLLLAFLSTCFMTFGLYNHRLNYYAKWITVGGFCPVFLDQCFQFPHVGCGVFDYYDALDDESDVDFNVEPNLSHDQNTLAFAEQILGSILLYPIALVGVALVVGLILACCLDFRGLERWAGGRERNSQDDEVQNLSRLQNTYGFSLVIIIIFVLIAIPLHVNQQREPKMFFVADSFGYTTNDWVFYNMSDLPQPPSNWDPNYTGDNGTIWTDCFNISTPVDYWGFANGWWKIHRQQIQAILPMV
jgi:hypothetical protein